MCFFFFFMHIIIYDIYIYIIYVFNIEYIHVELKNLTRLGQDFFFSEIPLQVPGNPGTLQKPVSQVPTVYVRKHYMLILSIWMFPKIGIPY